MPHDYLLFPLIKTIEDELESKYFNLNMSL